MNLASLQKKNVEEFGEYTSLIIEGKEYTNKQLYEMSNQVANGLKNIGLKHQDRVIVSMPNRVEVFLSYSGTWKAGGIVTPIIFLLQADEIRHILSDCHPRFIITSFELLPKIKEAAEGIESVEKIIVAGEIPENEKTDVRLYSFDEFYKKGSGFEIEDMKEDELSVILYTSGTTGKPKGVMLTHSNLHDNVLNLKKTRENYEVDFADGSVLSCLPLAHAYGLFLMAGGWMGKGKGIVMSWFDPEEVFETIEKYKVDAFPGVPTMLIYLLNHPTADKYDTSSVRVWASAAAPLPQEVKDAFEKKFGGVILQGYGLTESTAATCITPPGMTSRPANCVGKPIDNVVVKIVDDEGNELPRVKPEQFANPPEECIGEISIKGKGVMKGYYNMPEETAKVLHDGWLRSGDVGYLDEEGYLYISERKRDLIIRGGLNIYPKDVEEILVQHPAVMEVAVIGVPDPLYVEDVKAFVVLRFGVEKPTEQELLEFCKQRLAKFKCPKSVEFRAFLPKNPLGKIMKKVLREEEKAKQKV